MNVQENGAAAPKPKRKALPIVTDAPAPPATNVTDGALQRIPIADIADPAVRALLEQRGAHEAAITRIDRALAVLQEA